MMKLIKRDWKTGSVAIMCQRVKDCHCKDGGKVVYVGSYRYEDKIRFKVIKNNLEMFECFIYKKSQKISKLWLLGASGF